MSDTPNKDIFDKEEELKNDPEINEGDFKDRTRFPMTMHVDGMEFEPEIPLLVITRTSYDLLLTEDDVLKLYMFLAGRIKHKLFKTTRIRFIGRTEDDG